MPSKTNKTGDNTKMEEKKQKTNNNNLIMFRLDSESLKILKTISLCTKQNKNELAKDIITRYLRGL